MAKISAWVVWNSDENESDWRAAATEDEAWQNANDLGAHRVGLSWVPDTRGGIAA